jgi:3-deoxy-D-manno-octulosonic-acid transferase/heptosyltransferase-1
MRFNGLWKKKDTSPIDRPNSILIIKLSSIGDVVHSLPLLEVLRANFPDAMIDWLVEDNARHIIMGHKDIDHILVSNRKSWVKRLLTPDEISRATSEINGFIKALRKTDYDWVIDLQGLFKSGILAFLARGKRKIGLSTSREGASLFLTEPPCPVDLDHHAVDRYLAVAMYLKCDDAPWTGVIPINPVDREAVDQLLVKRGLQDRDVIAINPITRWSTKLWDLERFVLLADGIKNKWTCDVIFTGSTGDRDAIETITKAMERKAHNLAGETNLKELAYLYSKCDLLITTDSGPMHMAAAMGCPTVALFGPTAPWRTGPYGNGHIVIRDETTCSPCFKKRCNHMTCMKNITVERVLEAVEDAFNERS